MPTISSPTATVPLMQQLQTKIIKANLSMKQAPNPDSLKKIVGELSTVISEIEKEKNNAQSEEKFCCLRSRGWTKVETSTLILGGIGTLCGLVANVYDYKINTDPSSGGLVANSIALAFLGCAALTKLVVKKTQKKMDDYFSLQDRQLNEAISLQNFFVALNLYLEMDADQPRKKDKKLKECAHELKEVPSMIIPSKAKARWMRAAVQTLPPDSTLRKRLTEAERLVLQKKEEDETAKLPDEDPVAQAEQVEESSSYSSDEAPVPIRRRRKKKRSAFLKDDNADRSSNPSPKSSIATVQRQTTQRLLHQATQGLLDDLGLDIYCGDNCMFDKDGNLIKELKS